MPPSSSDNHTVADVEDAISALDDGGWWRLRYAAGDELGAGDAVHRPEDLLNEAFLRLLDGRRTWQREYGFADQVAIIMKSIASDWRRRDAADPVVIERDLYPPDEPVEVDDPSRLQEPRSPESDTDDALIAANEAREMAQLLADDPQALQVLECMFVGLSRRQMRQRTGMSEKQVEAAVRRVRRKARAAASGPAAASGRKSRVTEQVTTQVAQLLDVMEGELTRAEIMARLGLEHRPHFIEAYLRPALQGGWIEMTIPDKPNSRRQRYRRVGEGAARGIWPTPPATERVTTQVEELLGVMEGELTRAELMARLGLQNRRHFAKAYLQPALQAGLIEMTIPDKPRSRSQSYRRTARGRIAAPFGARVTSGSLEVEVGPRGVSTQIP